MQRGRAKRFLRLGATALERDRITGKEARAQVRGGDENISAGPGRPPELGGAVRVEAVADSRMSGEESIGPRGRTSHSDQAHERIGSAVSSE